MATTEINVLSDEDQQIYWDYRSAEDEKKRVAGIHGWGNLKYDRVLDLPKLAVKIGIVLLFGALVVLGWIKAENWPEVGQYGMGLATLAYLAISIQIFERIPHKNTVSGFQHPEVTEAANASNRAFSKWNNAGLIALHRAERFNVGFLNKVIIVGGEVWMLDEDNRVVTANPGPESHERREEIIDESGQTLEVPVETVEFFHRHAKATA